jgi:hypothetical protein
MNAQELLDLLKHLGLDVSGMHPDDLGSKISETVVLKKFEGDDQTGKPLETIVIQDGVVLEKTQEL